MYLATRTLMIRTPPPQWIALVHIDHVYPPTSNFIPLPLLSLCVCVCCTVSLSSFSSRPPQNPRLCLRGVHVGTQKLYLHIYGNSLQYALHIDSIQGVVDKTMEKILHKRCDCMYMVMASVRFLSPTLFDSGCSTEYEGVDRPARGETEEIRDRLL